MLKLTKSPSLKLMRNNSGSNKEKQKRRSFSVGEYMDWDEQFFSL